MTDDSVHERTSNLPVISVAGRHYQQGVGEAAPSAENIHRRDFELDHLSSGLLRAKTPEQPGDGMTFNPGSWEWSSTD